MYNIDSSDDEDTRPPYMTTETENNLSSANQDLGVSVTISGHRFIALTKETSWIGMCRRLLTAKPYLIANAVEYAQSKCLRLWALIYTGVVNITIPLILS